MTRYAPLWEQAQTYAAAVDRRLIAQVSGGPYPLVTGCAVTVSTGTMNMNIAAGGVVVPTPNNTGSTLCYSDAVEVVASPTAPASGSNRIDVVVCQARGNDLDGGSNNDFLFQVVAGTVATAGSEVAPATPAGAVALAQVRVIGGAASLNAANLLDRRILQPWAEPWGLITPPVSTTGNSGSIGATTADIPGMAVTFQALANRRYRVFIQQIIQQQTAASIANLFLRTGANVQLCATGRNARGLFPDLHLGALRRARVSGRHVQSGTEHVERDGHRHRDADATRVDFGDGHRAVRRARPVRGNHGRLHRTRRVARQLGLRAARWRVSLRDRLQRRAGWSPDPRRPRRVKSSTPRTRRAGSGTRARCSTRTGCARGTDICKAPRSSAGVNTSRQGQVLGYVGTTGRRRPVRTCILDRRLAEPGRGDRPEPVRARRAERTRHVARPARPSPRKPSTIRRTTPC